MRKIQLLIVDDHKLVRSGIISLLDNIPEIEILGEAASGNEALEMAEQKNPDVVLMDISMPGMSGADATKMIKLNYPATKVLILTMFDTEEYIYSVLKSGADGIIHKSSGTDELVEGIKKVDSGTRYFGRSFSAEQIDEIMEKFSEEELGKPHKKVILSKREKQILKFIAEGKTNQEIGDVLYISPRTVEYHKNNLMQKLKIKSIVALSRYAFEHEYDFLKK